MSFQPTTTSAISVMNFGARGDNITDDRIAAQNAINYFQSRNLGGTVLFPDAYYRMSGRLVITGNNIILQGGSNSWLNAIDDFDFQKIIISGASTGQLASGNSVLNIKINGGRTTGNSEQYAGVINLVNTKNATIGNCSVIKYLGIGVFTEYNNENTDILNNTFEEYHLGIFNHGRVAGAGLKYLTVDNNVFDRAWYPTPRNFFTAIKIQGPDPDMLCFGHKITNNKIYAPSQLGIELWGNVKNSIVANNYLESGDFGISIANNSSFITVEGNTTKNTNFYGIEIAESANCVVTSNIVDGNLYTRDGIIINSSQDIIVNTNSVNACSHAHITTYNSSTITRNVDIVGNIMSQSGNGSVPFYYQGGHNINVSENILECKGTGGYFVFIDTDTASPIPFTFTGLTIARNDFIGSISDWGILYYYGTSSGRISNVLIEDNRTYGVRYCGIGMINSNDYPPSNALHRDNYSQTGNLGYSIPDAQIPAAGGTPYGTTNIKNGFQYYGNYQWTPPSEGVTGNGMWLCVWSGGFGETNAPRVRISTYAPEYNNSATTTELWASCIPYQGGSLKNTLTALPQADYFFSNILQAKTLAHDSVPNNSLWVQMAPCTSGASTRAIDIFYSDQNSLANPYATYTEPTDTTNNAKIYFNQSGNNEMMKLSKGVSIGNGTRIYSTTSGVLIFEANSILGLTGTSASIPNLVYTTGDQTINGIKTFNGDTNFKQLNINNGSPGEFRADSFNVRYGSTDDAFDSVVFGHRNIGLIIDSNNNNASASMFIAKSNFQLSSATILATFSGNGNVRFNTYGAGTLNTDANGNITATSDERLKNIVGPFTRGLNDLTGIVPIYHTWKPESNMETSGIYCGFSAQNIHKSIPEAVRMNSQGVYSFSDRPVLATVVNAMNELLNKLLKAEERIVYLEKYLKKKN